MGLSKYVFVFTHLTEDFEHLSMMKKITSLNVCRGPECSYTFLHLTLQEYMAALYIAIYGTSSDEYMLTESDSPIVMRFFVGICRHVEYQSHALYQKLVKQLSSSYAYANSLVHCVYECPSIMDCVELDYSKYEHGAMVVEPWEGFDWYVTGYCISHFDVRWGLSVEDVEEVNTDLFLKGLGSSSIRRIHYLALFQECFSQFFSQTGKFCQIIYLSLDRANISDSKDVNILQQIIAPGSEL